MMKKNKTDNKSISKFLSLILRHKPEAVGAKLDGNGWADTKTLIRQINDYSKNKFLNLDLLKEIVVENNKQRFELNEDSTKIRARQGHSLSNVDLELKPQTPPDVLYHGTVQKFLESIYDKGLIKGKRQYVHLSADIKTAEMVGSRRGKAFILFVDAKQMHDDGILFYCSTNGVWLTNYIDPKYIGKIWVERT